MGCQQAVVGCGSARGKRAVRPGRLLQETVQVTRRRSTPLALRTEMSAALGYQDAANGITAFYARFAGALIHIVLYLKTSLPSVDVDVIRYRRSAGRNGFAKHASQRFVQSLHTIFAEPGRDGQRVTPRAEQRFSGIDISDSATASLVHQQGFDSG